MIYSLLGNVRASLGSKTTSNVQPHISSPIFQSLRAVAALTALSCILVTARTYIGDNINCIASGMEGEELKAVESYCFISSTFTLSNLTLPSQSAHPGVGPVPRKEVYPPGTKPKESPQQEGVSYHSYYQWVPFMLALQSMFLYLPAVLWKNKEDGYLNTILVGLHRVHVDKTETAQKSEQSAALFCYTMGKSNTKYFASFVALEVIGFVVALTNLFVTNIFLNGKFFYYGTGALTYLSSSVTDPNNPLNEIFPKVGKCTWYRYGPSGTIQSHDALCVLPLNIVNEKTYVLLWLGYIALCVVTGLLLVYHMLFFILRLKPAIVSSTAVEGRADLALLLTRCDVSDKFILWNLQSKIVNFPLWLQCAVRNMKGR